MKFLKMSNEEFFEMLDRWSLKLEDFADKYHKELNKKIDLYSDYLSKFADWVLDRLTTVSDVLMDYYKAARYSTFPLHWIWIALYFYINTYSVSREPLDEHGSHYISGLPGDGKSTLMWQKIHDYAKMTGKCAYITTEMEKVKYDELGQAYLNHIPFKLEEFFGKRNPDDPFGSQLKRFNSDLACCLAVDELHFYNNNRNNRSGAYNAIFIPFINNIVLMRHLKIHWILLSSQMPKNDTQIMSILKSYNEVKIKKGFVYSKWLEDGKFTRRVKGWRVRTYSVSTSTDYLKLEKRKRWFKRCTVDFSDFESLNMAKALNSAPVDRREVLQ